jgi:hypothetical protein
MTMLSVWPAGTAPSLNGRHVDLRLLAGSVDTCGDVVRDTGLEVRVELEDHLAVASDQGAGDRIAGR